jgi:hypothetical protein
MAIDPRIALGIQPVQQQPNMLAQYAQVMAIKAAQQEMQGNEDFRNLFAGGANFDDPEFQRRGYMANAKGFQDLLGKRATTQKTEMEALGKEIDLRRDALVNVNTPEDYLKWHEANHQGKVGSFLKSIGQTPSRESIIAELSKPGGFEKLKKESALGATRLAQELYNTERTRISSGPAYQQAALAQRQFDLEQADSARIASILRGEPSAAPAAAVTPPMMGGGGGGGVAPNTSVSPAPMAGSPAPATGPSVVAQPNVLATQVAPPPAPSVNALDPNAQKPNTLNQISELIRIGKPKAIQAADALIKEYNLLNPVQKIERDANGALVLINERTNVATPVVGKDGKPLASGVAPVWNEKAQVYMTPPTPENPAGKVTEMPELRQIAKKRSGIETLDIAGFNKNTGTNEISDFIKQSTSGLAENALAKTAGALFGKGTPGAEAIAKLETRANELTLGLAPNGSLGAGFSNDDRTFMLAKLGDVANANKPMNVRLAAWEDVMKRAARNAGVDYKGTGGASGGGGNTGGARVYSPQEQQALEWANSNSSDPRAAQIRQRLGVQ